MARRKSSDIDKKDIQIEAPIEVMPIGQAAEEAILDAAEYLSCSRAICHVIDGNKCSTRRLIWSALQFPKGELQPSVKIINGMASYHPHSLDGITGLHAVLVKAGVLKGAGSFGTNSILSNGGGGDKGEPAAPRYTKSALSDLYYEIIKPLLISVPQEASPVGPMEIKYVPTPVPMCLILNSLVSGIAIGISTNYPNFSPKSLYTAMVKDDPSYLEPNVDLILDKQESDLKGLWERGKAKIVYSYKLSKYVNEDGKQGFLFEGSTDLFSPNLRKINKYVDKGEVFIEDMTTKNGPRMFVGLVNNRGISIDNLEKLCRQCCYDATVYNLNVTDGKTCFRIPLRDWLRYTYDNYINLLKEVNDKNIDKVRFDIAVQEALPLISNYIINENPKASDTEIMKVFQMPKEIVEAVMAKPIGQLRKNKDNSERIKALKDKLKELKKFDPVAYTEEIINKL